MFSNNKCVVAIAKVSGTVDTIITLSPTSSNRTDEIERIKSLAVKRAIGNGAKNDFEEGGVEVVELDVIPLPVNISSNNRKKKTD